MSSTEEQRYESVAIITKISATSRASVKVKDSFYTVEYAEERAIPADVDFDIEEERRILWDTVNDEVDNQVADIIKNFK